MFKLNFMVTWQRTTNPSPLRWMKSPSKVEKSFKGDSKPT
jgi:hypothetical protein